jgi:hypothetical protein
MKSRPGQGLTVISKKIRLKQNDHASRRTQYYPHTRREQHPVHTRRAQHRPNPFTPPTLVPYISRIDRSDCRNQILDAFHVHGNGRQPAQRPYRVPARPAKNRMPVRATDVRSWTSVTGALTRPSGLIVLIRPPQRSAHTHANIPLGRALGWKHARALLWIASSSMSGLPTIILAGRSG